MCRLFWASKSNESSIYKPVTWYAPTTNTHTRHRWLQVILNTGRKDILNVHSFVLFKDDKSLISTVVNNNVMDTSVDDGNSRCAICYEEFGDGSEFDEEDARSAGISVHVKGCQHRFCRDCLSQHCSYFLSNRDYPIQCPSSATNCANTIDDEQVRALLCSSAEKTVESSSGVAEWKCYLRLQRLSQDSSLVSCSLCQEIVSPVKHIKDENDCPNTLECPSCRHVFCSIHGDAHPIHTCDFYSKRKTSRIDRKSENLIRKNTKPCSHCGAPIEKASGCDHVVCPSCGDDMCYRCGKHDLTGTTIRVCKNCDRSFVDHRHIWKYRLLLCLSLPLLIPFVIVYVAITASIAIASLCCCFCQCVGLEMDEEGDKSYSLKRGAARVTLMVFLPVLDLLGSCGADCGLSALLQKHGLENQALTLQHTGTTTTFADIRKDDIDFEDYESDSSHEKV